MRIFLSFAGEQSRLAETLYRKLFAADYDVFFASDAIRASDEYDQRIRQEMATADKVIFLASRESITEGRYTMTELGMASRKWPDPTGRVMTVLVDDVDYDDLPPYLSAVTSAFRAKGNLPSEVTAVVVERWPLKKALRWPWKIAAVLLIGAVGLWAFTVWDKRGGVGPVLPGPIESRGSTRASASTKKDRYKVTLTRFVVHSDGDDFTDGDGDFFWDLRVAGQVLSRRSPSDVLELGTGDATTLDATMEIELEPGSPLKLRGHITDKDRGTSGSDDVIVFDAELPTTTQSGSVRRHQGSGDPEVELFYEIVRRP